MPTVLPPKIKSPFSYTHFKQQQQTRPVRWNSISRLTSSYSSWLPSPPPAAAVHRLQLLARSTLLLSRPQTLLGPALLWLQPPVALQQVHQQQQRQLRPQLLLLLLLWLTFPAHKCSRT